jgi:hypothetical protein
MIRKKTGLLHTTSGNSTNENFQWLHQAFRSIVPQTDVDLTMQQNSVSPQSSKKIEYLHKNSNLLLLFSFRFNN